MSRRAVSICSNHYGSSNTTNFTLPHFVNFLISSPPTRTSRQCRRPLSTRPPPPTRRAWPQHKGYTPGSMSDELARNEAHRPVEPLTISPGENPRRIQVQSLGRAGNWIDVDVIRAEHRIGNGRVSRVWFTFPGSSPSGADWQTVWPGYRPPSPARPYKTKTPTYRRVSDPLEAASLAAEGKPATLEAMERMDVFGRRFWKESVPYSRRSKSNLRGDSWPSHMFQLPSASPPELARRAKPHARVRHHAELHSIEVKTSGNSGRWVSLPVIATRHTGVKGRVYRMWYTFAGDVPSPDDEDCAWPPTHGRARHGRYLKDPTPLRENAALDNGAASEEVPDEFWVMEVVDFAGRRFWREVLSNAGQTDESTGVEGESDSPPPLVKALD